MNDIQYKFDSLTYNARPVNLQEPNHLKCVVSVTNKNNYTYRDKIDLYEANKRKLFIKRAVPVAEKSSQIIEQGLTELIDSIEKQRSTVEPVQPAVEIPPNLKQEAVEYLKHPDLVNNIITSFHKSGYIGEELNLLTAYLAATSRKLSFPLSLMIMSRSGAGKSALQDAILKFMPEEEYQSYTRLTDQVLFYKDKDELRHKLIAVEEIKGAQGASYSLRNLLTSHGLSINATITDPATGLMKAVARKVFGPISMIVNTTCVDDIDYELLNRFLIITVDESWEQTQKILAKQRQARTLAGIIQKRNSQNEEILQKNIQRLLKPVEIVNPYADNLKFDHKNLIMRRKHLQYLNLIDAVTLLHQYQRPIKKAEDETGEFEYIEVAPRDIQIANKIAEKIITSGNDELMPPAKNLHKELVKMNEGNGTHGITRKEIRDYTGWNDYQIRTYLRQLVDLEYVGIISGNNGIKYQYELLYEGNGSKPIELIDPNSLIIKTSPKETSFPTGQA